MASIAYVVRSRCAGPFTSTICTKSEGPFAATGETSLDIRMHLQVVNTAHAVTGVTSPVLVGKLDDVRVLTFANIAADATLMGTDGVGIPMTGTVRTDTTGLRFDNFLAGSL